LVTRLRAGRKNTGGESRKRPDHASPAVTNMTASMASRADFPAQITNWNAGK
jgi:hypothetical protein